MKKQPKKKAVAKPEQKITSGTGQLWYLLLPVVATFLLFIPSISNDFVSNWDDNLYILYNPNLQRTGFDAISGIFSEFYFANYHPLTSLTFWCEFQFFGNNPIPFHFLNFLLHLCNTALVFLLIKNLFKEPLAAMFAALLFGIHPMHVESVAWISERKDLLYSLFFLLSLISYQRYLRNPEKKRLLLYSLILFVCSLMSKSAAVVLPVVLLLFDWFGNRKLKAGVWLEKLPFFALSVLFGILAIKSQSAGNSINTIYIPDFSFLERLFLAGYAVGEYILKAILPFGLSALHFYPVSQDGTLDMAVWLSPVWIAAIAAGIWFFRNNHKYITFGLLFFLINIGLVIQILPVGQAIISERYSYIPYIGLFIVPAMFVALLNRKKHKLTLLATMVLLGFSILCAVTTFNRIPVWKNGVTLFSDVIEKYPGSDYGYFVRGNSFYDMKKYDAALRDFDKALQIMPDYAVEYNNRGNARHFLNDNDGAVNDYCKAIELDSAYGEAYANRGISLSSLTRFDEAITDFNKAILLGYNKVDVYGNRGVAKMRVNDPDGAIADYDTALVMNPGDPMVYYNRGIVKAQKGDNEGAITDYSEAIRVKNDFSDYYLNRGVCYLEMKKYEPAVSDFDQVIRMAPNHAGAIFNKGVALLYSGKPLEACGQFARAQQLGHPQAAIAINAYCKSTK
ncbi:MAG: tetratricopeptide repeat protein [Bacteroidetes bacterium]|nr:tetratricopeptide repeat protein [Bacteroidota bacterium]MBU1719012.1 tetratricopeptide repeat protein [Bacteroidota bacterium]